MPLIIEEKLELKFVSFVIFLDFEPITNCGSIWISAHIGMFEIIEQSLIRFELGQCKLTHILQHIFQSAAKGLKTGSSCASSCSLR